MFIRTKCFKYHQKQAFYTFHSILWCFCSRQRRDCIWQSWPPIPDSWCSQHTEVSTSHPRFLVFPTNWGLHCTFTNSLSSRTLLHGTKLQLLSMTFKFWDLRQTWSNVLLASENSRAFPAEITKTSIIPWKTARLWQVGHINTPLWVSMSVLVESLLLWWKATISSTLGRKGLIWLTTPTFHPWDKSEQWTPGRIRRQGWRGDGEGRCLCECSHGLVCYTQLMQYM